MNTARLLRSLVILSAAAVVLGTPASAGAQENAERRESPIESARAVLSDGAYQRELPVWPPPNLETSGTSSTVSEPPENPPEPAREVSPTASDGASPAARAEPESDTDGASGADRTWLWLLAGLIGAALLAYILLLVYRARRTAKTPKLPGRRKRKKHKPAPAPAPAAVHINEPTILDEADALAGAGRYGEAIHFLLLNGLEDVARRTSRRIPPALTNRELVLALPLAEALSGALSVLVRLSERSHFGGAALSAADYQVSREKFRLFALESGAA